MIRVATALAALAVLGGAAPGLARADDDHVVRGRVSLPLGGRPVDVARYAGPGETVRLVVRGTLSSALDGSTIDALSRWRSETRVDAEGPFVVLPQGARVIERDPDAHRYVALAPQRARMPVALNVTPLAQRHLVTRGELLRGLTGAIEVDVMGPLPAGATTTRGRGGEVAALSPPSMGLPATAFAGVALGVPFVVAFGFVAWRRRRRGPDAYVRRAHRAMRAIEREAPGLGPAFDEVVAASRRVLDGAEALRYELRRTESAERRCDALGDGAAARRDALRAERARCEHGLRDLARRLERTAADLAAHGAGREGRRDLPDLVRELDGELATAVSADEQARA